MQRLVRRRPTSCAEPTNRPRFCQAIAYGFAMAIFCLPGGCRGVDEPLSSNRAAGDAVQLRIATFNTALAGDAPGALVERLTGDEDTQAQAIAAILQRVRPDIVLLNEFDYDPEGRAVDQFLANYLARAQRGEAPLRYEFRYFATVNTGVPSGFDLNANGRSDDPDDGFGFGRYPGQYGMLLLSRFPIAQSEIRRFQLLRWSAMPGALKPVNPDGTDYYPPSAWSSLRLSSKSHWDVPIDIDGRRLHVLAAHPTPPAFDGPEKRNARRNHDEIRLWVDYLEPTAASWIVDDGGASGGLPRDRDFVILGDLNADPNRGSGFPGAIRQLLNHPRVDSSVVPQSAGAVSAAQRAGLAEVDAHRADTADFSEPVPGNLRVDYVLPSRGLDIVAGGVFWPAEGETADWVRASDHRLVWMDVRIE